MHGRTHLKNFLEEGPIWLPTRKLLSPDPYVHMNLKLFIQNGWLKWAYGGGAKRKSH